MSFLPSAKEDSFRLVKEVLKEINSPLLALSPLLLELTLHLSDPHQLYPQELLSMDKPLLSDQLTSQEESSKETGTDLKEANSQAALEFLILTFSLAAILQAIVEDTSRVKTKLLQVAALV